MGTGILRHLPEPGAALEQDSIILENMRFAYRTWHIDQKAAARHTPEDQKFMRDIVKPERSKDG
jgi:hypothetical protein